MLAPPAGRGWAGAPSAGETTLPDVPDPLRVRRAALRDAVTEQRFLQPEPPRTQRQMKSLHCSDGANERSAAPGAGSGVHRSLVVIWLFRAPSVINDALRTKQPGSVST